LNIKGIAFKTEWIEYPDIEGFYKKHGIPFVNTKDDGSPYYALPIIYDKSTNKYIVDSFHIIAYLDDQYPDTLTLLPKESRALQAGFESATMSIVGGAASTILMPAVHSILNEPSQIFFFRTRGLKQTKPPQEMVEEHWKKLEEAFGVIDRWLKRNGESQKFIAGDAISYVDVALAARVMFIKRVLDVDGSNGWERIQGWHGGRWAGLVADFQQYE